MPVKFGAAGIRPCVSSFGADQFDDRDVNYKRRLDRFFNLFYLAVTVGAIAAFTLVVYIQMHHGWAAAFGALAIAMGASNALFFAGTSLYRHKAPGGSPLTRVAQVLVAAFRKRYAGFDSGGYVGLHEVAGPKSAIRGSAKIEHTGDFRWLDKAALRLVQDDEEGEINPWRLCTVTQVEEVKLLVRLLPVPTCTVMLSVVLTEFLTLSVQQAYTLNTALPLFGSNLPVTCMPVFPCLAIFLVLALYYQTFVPLARRVTGHPHGASQLQRVGLGLAFSILSVVWAGVFERYRRRYAVEHGYLHAQRRPPRGGEQGGGGPGRRTPRPSARAILELCARTARASPSSWTVRQSVSAVTPFLNASRASSWTEHTDASVMAAVASAANSATTTAARTCIHGARERVTSGMEARTARGSRDS